MQEATNSEKGQTHKKKHEIHANFFSFEGRLNRARYFWTMFTIGITAYLVLIFCPSLANTVVLLTPVITFFPVIKRLHDMNKSGGFALLMFFPLLNLVLGLILLFKKGTTGVNRYGDDPLAT